MQVVTNVNEQYRLQPLKKNVSDVVQYCIAVIQATGN